MSALETHIGTWKLILFDTPPSLNRVGSRGSFREFARVKKRWEYDLWLLCTKRGRPKCKHVQASAVLTFPTRRRRDEGNYRPMVEKALGDALQAAGWISDDTPDQFIFAELTFDPELGPNRTTITLYGELDRIR